jgi:hypothetical protein
MLAKHQGKFPSLNKKQSCQLTSLSYVSGKNPQQVKGANLPLKNASVCYMENGKQI